MRDHYKREKKEEKGTTGKPAKKKRAVYWQRLQFLDTVEDERSSFSNDLTPSHNETPSPTAPPGMDDLNVNEEDDPTDQTPQDLTRPGSSQQAQTEIFTPSPDGQTSDVTQTPSTKTRKESIVLQRYLLDRQRDTEHFKRCLEDLIKPQETEHEIDMFFKTMAATVKKFRPDLAIQTKASVFKVVIEMELLNQQSCFPGSTGFQNI